MRIQSITKVMLGSALLAGAVSSCAGDEQTKNAECNAAKYLTGTEYLQAKNNIPTARFSSEYNKVVAYWDSIITSDKVKEAYEKGNKMVMDSAKSRTYNSTNPYDTISFPEASKGAFRDMRAGLVEEVSKKRSGEELYNLLQNEPASDKTVLFENGADLVHYWNQIAAQGAQRKAYNDGANAARKELNTRKTNSLQSY